MAGHPRRHRPLPGAQDVRYGRYQRDAGIRPEQRVRQRLYQQRHHRLLLHLHGEFLREPPHSSAVRLHALLHPGERGQGAGHHCPGNPGDGGRPGLAGIRQSDGVPVQGQPRPGAGGGIGGEHPADHPPDPIRLPQGVLYAVQHGSGVRGKRGAGPGGGRSGRDPARRGRSRHRPGLRPGGIPLPRQAGGGCPPRSGHPL